MIRSLYSGISGMAAHQTKLNVIGNNIANVNTYGFKASRVVFSDVLYQNLSTATGATATTGGTNASQLGYGTKVGSIDMMNTISSGASTGRALDVYIAGEGYLAVQPTAGANRYTRVGNLKFDAEGNLTDGAGSKVMGIPTVDGNPVLDANGTLGIDGLEAIKVDPIELEKYTGITIGKSGEITGIRAGDPEVTIKYAEKGWLKKAVVEPTSNYTGDVKLTINSDVEFTINGGIATSLQNPDFVASPSTANLVGDVSLVVAGGKYTLTGTDKSGNKVSVEGTNAAGVITFDLKDTTGKPLSAKFSVEEVDPLTPTADGTYLLGTVAAVPGAPITVSATVTNKGGTSETITIPWTTPPTTPTVDIPIGAGNDMITLTVDAAKFDALYTAAATVNSTVATVETGSDKPVTLGYLAIAKFANNDGLLQDGQGYFMESANSGEAIASKAGTNGTGGTESANLEMSNVDLSQEFTDMIVAQRGFQANSRIITVSDSILEELINLKR